MRKGEAEPEAATRLQRSECYDQEDPLNDIAKQVVAGWMDPTMELLVTRFDR